MFSILLIEYFLIVKKCSERARFLGSKYLYEENIQLQEKAMISRKSNYKHCRINWRNFKASYFLHFTEIHFRRHCWAHYPYHCPSLCQCPYQWSLTEVELRHLQTIFIIFVYFPTKLNSSMVDCWVCLSCCPIKMSDEPGTFSLLFKNYFSWWKHGGIYRFNIC